MVGNNKNDDDNINKNSCSSVSFGTVSVREYGMILGTNPATSDGCPVCLEWDYSEKKVMSINEYETKNKIGRLAYNFHLSCGRRRGILQRAGFTEDDFTVVERQIKKERFKRRISQYISFPILCFQSRGRSNARRKATDFVRKYRREHSL